MPKLPHTTRDNRTALVSLLVAALLGTLGVADGAATSHSSSIGSSKLVLTTLAPTSGATISGNITWQANVTGGVPRRIDFAIDGTVLWKQTTAPYYYGGTTGALDTSSFSNGSHSLTATAYPNGKGSPVKSSLTVKVSNQEAVPPSSSLPPALSGSAQVGQSLSSSPGSWSGSSPMSYSFQWLRCDASGASCVSIDGATGSSYVAASADVGSTLRSLVTASNSAGSATARSTQSSVVVSSDGWTSLVNEDFSAKPDGYWPSGFCKYSGLDRVYNQSYFNPSHAYVQGGLLHLLSRYDGTGPNGAQWYTGGFSMLGSNCGQAPPAGGYPYSGINSRITVRMRLVETGTDAMGHRNVLCWPDVGNRTYGEADMWESQRALNSAGLFVHYGEGTSDSRVTWTYPTTWNWTDWHTYRFERKSYTVKIYIDDMATPIHTYTGDSTTLPDNLVHWVLQQQMHNPTGTPAPSTDQEDWQIASINIARAS